MRIFRIEHPDTGKGPFTHFSENGVDGYGRFMRYMKEPNEFKHSKPYHYGVHYFGFSGEEYLLAATQDRWKLHDVGFRVVVLEVGDEHCIEYPDGQVAFIRKHATSMACYTFNQLIDLTYKRVWLS